MIARRLWPVFLTLCIPAFASITDSQGRVHASAALGAREQRLGSIPARSSEFSDVPHVTARSGCEQTRPPEALTTPNPILGASEPGLKIKISFIVGTDGRVHSPLILESSTTAGDHAVLDTVRAWRYRPAMCNGVPTETEGKVEFSSR
jgi:TonB family protein